MGKVLRGDSIAVEFWGKFACFSCPWAKVDRYSYEAPTPTAAIGMLSAIYSKPAEFFWEIEKIEILNPIKRISFPVNESILKITRKCEPIIMDESRTQRMIVAMKDVRYRITAHIVPRVGQERRLHDIQKQALRRIKQGQCFYQPCLGLNDFIAEFDLSDGKRQPIPVDIDMGYVVHDLWDMDDWEPRDTNYPVKRTWFHCVAKQGVINVPERVSAEINHCSGGDHLLQALYSYSVNHGLTLPLKCAQMKPAAVVYLTSDGSLVDVIRREKSAQPVLCPTVGTASSSPELCDPYITKMEILLGLDADGKNPDKNRVKRGYFLKVMQDTVKENPDAAAVYFALTNTDSFAKISAALSEFKLAPFEKVSFVVDGRNLADDPRTIDFWQKYFIRKSTNTGFCMITGQETELATNMKGTRGLPDNKGAMSGKPAMLTSFDKAAFRSYGLEKHLIAPMGEAAASAVVDAIDALSAKAPSLEGMKLLCWYKNQMPEEKDIFPSLVGFDLDGENTKSPDTSTMEQDAMIKVNELFKCVESGEDASILGNTYYLLGITANQSRAVIRLFETGDCSNLVNSIHQWYEDTSIIKASGNGMQKHYSVKALLRGISLKSKDNTKQIRAEFGNELPYILNAILRGDQIPVMLVRKALQRIVHDIYVSKDEEAMLPWLNSRAIALLKAYIVRKERKEGQSFMSNELNKNLHNPAYHCGRMLAVFGEIQRLAYLNQPVTTSVVQAHYDAMSKAPVRVYGHLSKLSVVHLNKIKKEQGYGLYKKMNDMMCEIAEDMGDSVPGSMSVADQAYFSLGYQHQIAEMNRLYRAAAQKKAQVGQEESAAEKN